MQLNELYKLTFDTDDDEKYRRMCAQWAKIKHKQWCQERENDGWVYGPSLSFKDKRHPLLKPWDELPEKFRVIDSKEPQIFIDMLEKHGYLVAPRHEIENAFKILRSLVKGDD